MGAPQYNRNGCREYGLIQRLRAACEQDDFKRMRQGCEVLLTRFAAHGGIREAEFLRDTLDGRPTQAIDLKGNGGDALTSLQVLFVDAATRLANAQADKHRVIEAEPALHIKQANENNQA